VSGGRSELPQRFAVHTTPVSLLARLRQPSAEQAWQRFVELYTPVLYACARSLDLCDADAADLVQDVFLLLVQKLPEFQYDPHKSFRAWLRTIMLNKWRDNLKRAQGLRRLPDAALDVSGAQSRLVPQPEGVSWFLQRFVRTHRNCIGFSWASRLRRRQMPWRRTSWSVRHALRRCALYRPKTP
jgi:RNA polymerase sigma factor (sigma-70 family)